MYDEIFVFPVVDLKLLLSKLGVQSQTSSSLTKSSGHGHRGAEDWTQVKVCDVTDEEDKPTVLFRCLRPHNLPAQTG